METNTYRTQENRPKPHLKGLSKLSLVDVYMRT